MADGGGQSADQRRRAHRGAPDTPDDSATRAREDRCACIYYRRRFGTRSRKGAQVAATPSRQPESPPARMRQRLPALAPSHGSRDVASPPAPPPGPSPPPPCGGSFLARPGAVSAWKPASCRPHAFGRPKQGETRAPARQSEHPVGRGGFPHSSWHRLQSSRNGSSCPGPAAASHTHSAGRTPFGSRFAVQV